MDRVLIINKFMKKNFKVKIFALLVLSFLVVFPVISFAQGSKVNSPSNSGSSVNSPPVNSSDGKILNPISADTLDGFILVILKGVIKIMIPVIALAIIYCGFLFVQARGNPEALGKAKTALIYTLIGAAILLGSWAIAQLISNTVLAL